MNSYPLEDCVDMIDTGYGIKLNWSEKLALRYYLRCFEEQFDKGNTKDAPHSEAIHLFMIDYFGLDSIELSKEKYYMGEGKFKKLGLGFLNTSYYIGDDMFREYCKRNIDKWRDERNLI